MPTLNAPGIGWVQMVPTPPPQPITNVTYVTNITTVAPQATPVTPVYDPKIEANALYGKPMPLFAGGYARIGSSPAPIIGPYLNSGRADFAVSFGVPANVAGDRKIYKMYLDNELAWSAPAGGTSHADGTFAAESFQFLFRPGTLTQGVLGLETTHFPGDENAYRPQMVLEIRNLPYQRFLDQTGKPIPYVACEIGDVTGAVDPLDGINLGDALERVAHSPWAGYTSGTFEAIDITDVVPALLIKDNFSVVDLCKSVARVYRNLDLLQSDKLRIRDRASTVTPDFIFDRDSILDGDNPILTTRAGATLQRREVELLAIDPDQDYTVVPSLAKIPRDPAVISAAVGKGTITLPLVMNADTRQSLVTFVQNYEENARRKVMLKVGAAGYEIEPGDLFALVDVADGFDNEVFKCTQTTHGADWTVEVEGEAILRCSIYSAEFDPFLEYVILLMSFDANVADESPAVQGNATLINATDTTSVDALFGEALETNGLASKDGAYFPANVDWQLSTSNSDEFCIEVWVRPSTIAPVDSTIIGVWGGGIPITSWMLYINTSGNGELTFAAETASGAGWSATPTTSGLTWVSGTWYYIRVDKDATGKVRLYRGAQGDGTAAMLASATPSDSSISDDHLDAGAVLSIGCNSAGGGRTFPGLIEEPRITKGVSRSPSDAGVPMPTAPYPRT